MDELCIHINKIVSGHEWPNSPRVVPYYFFAKYVWHVHLCLHLRKIWSTVRDHPHIRELWNIFPGTSETTYNVPRAGEIVDIPLGLLRDL